MGPIPFLAHRAFCDVIKAGSLVGYWNAAFDSKIDREELDGLQTHWMQNISESFSQDLVS